MSIENTSLHCQTEHIWKSLKNLSTQLETKSISRVINQSVSSFMSGTLNTPPPPPLFFYHLTERKQLANNLKGIKIIAAKDVSKSNPEVPKNREDPKP